MTEAERLDRLLRLAQEQAKARANIPMLDKAPNTNPGVNPDAPADMHYNPNTGQYTSRELLANHMRQNGVSNAESATIGAGQGVSFGGGDEAFAAGYSALPGSGSMPERYTHAREYARAMNEASKAENPYVHGASEIGGGVATGLTYGLPAIAGRGLGGQMAAGGMLGAGEGFTYGALSSEGENRLRDGGRGAIMGLGFGIGAPVATTMVASGAKAASSPVGTAVRSVTGRPSQKRANDAIAATFRRSGKSADDVAQEVADAVAAGQPEFRIMDALGRQGARRANGIVRSGGDGSEEIAEFLRNRQMSQPDRMAAFTEDAFDLAGTTAKQTRTALEKGRNAAADLDFGGIRAKGEPVDIRGAVSEIDAILKPFDDAGIASASRKPLEDLRRALIGEGKDGTYELSDFSKVFARRRELRDDITSLFKNGRVEAAKDLVRVRTALDDALAASSPEYRQAMADYAHSSRVMEAADAGGAAARPGQRGADTVAEFGALTPDEQAAYRVGYGDKLLARVESTDNAPQTAANRARKATSPKAKMEADALAADPQLYAGRIGRENQMHETFATALTNSKTADNLADIEDLQGFDAGPIVNALTSNWRQAAQQIGARGANAFRGLDDSTRTLIARALMSGDADILRRAVASVEKADTKRKVVDAIMRITAGQNGQVVP
jgi:hypothetical protein